MTQIAYFQLIVGGGFLSLVYLLLYSYANPIDPATIPLTNYFQTEDSQVLLEPAAAAALSVPITEPNTHQIIPNSELRGQKITSLEQKKTSQSSTFVINYAPHLSYNPKLCSNAKMFGRPHQGGWFVCADHTMKPISTQSSLSALSTIPTLPATVSSISSVTAADTDAASTVASPERCIVYSFGLGADW